MSARFYITAALGEHPQLREQRTDIGVFEELEHAEAHAAYARAGGSVDVRVEEREE
jgi:hypothetical protein